MKRALAITGLLYCTLIWGATFILVKWSVETMDVYYFLSLRFGLAFVLLFVLFYKKAVDIDIATIKSAFILSIFLTGGYVAQTEGLRLTSSSNAALITGLYLILIPIICMVFFKKKVDRYSWFGVALSLIGLALLTRYNVATANIGDFLVFLCAVSFAVHITLTGHYANRHKLVPLVVYQFLFLAIFALVPAISRDAVTLDISRIAWISIVITAVFATVIGMLIQTMAQRTVDATRIGVIFALESVFGAIIGYYFGGDQFTLLALIGAFLMVAGMIVTEIHPAVRFLRDKIFT